MCGGQVVDAWRVVTGCVVGEEGWLAKVVWWVVKYK